MFVTSSSQIQQIEIYKVMNTHPIANVYRLKEMLFQRFKFSVPFSRDTLKHPRNKVVTNNSFKQMNDQCKLPKKLENNTFNLTSLAAPQSSNLQAKMKYQIINY